MDGDDLILKYQENLGKLKALRKEIEAQAPLLYGAGTALSVPTHSNLLENNPDSKQTLPHFSNHNDENVVDMNNSTGNLMNIFPGFTPMQGILHNQQQLLNNFNPSIFDPTNISQMQNPGSGIQPHSSNLDHRESPMRVSFHKNVINNGPSMAPDSKIRRVGRVALRDHGNMWQNRDHEPHRREMVKFIAQIITTRKREPSRKWMADLPFKSKKLEERLYMTASSFEEYMDKTTVMKRLTRVANDIIANKRTKNSNYNRSPKLPQDSLVERLKYQGSKEPHNTATENIYFGGNNSQLSQHALHFKAHKSMSMPPNSNHANDMYVKSQNFMSRRASDPSCHIPQEFQTHEQSQINPSSLGLLHGAQQPPTLKRKTDAASSTEFASYDNTDDGHTSLQNSALTNEIDNLQSFDYDFSDHGLNDVIGNANSFDWAEK